MTIENFLVKIEKIKTKRTTEVVLLFLYEYALTGSSPNITYQTKNSQTKPKGLLWEFGASDGTASCLRQSALLGDRSALLTVPACAPAH